MKSVSVSGSPRENVGKKDAKGLRRQGLVPCVLYGGKEQVAFAMPELSFRDIIFTPDACLIKLEVNGKTYNSILQDAQYHPVSGKIVHCDFLEIFPDKPIKMDVPIRVTGNSPGVIKGGKLITKLRKLKVKGLMDALPDTIEVNISKLNIADSVKVGQLSVEGIEFLDPANAVVVIVKMTRGAGAGGDDDDEAEVEGGEAAPTEEAAPAAE